MASNVTLYSYCSTLTVGCPVWTNPERTIVASSGYYSVFDYQTEGTRYISVNTSGIVTSINNLCPIGPGSVIATQSGFGTGIIEVARGENSTTLTPFYTAGRDWIEAKSTSNGGIILAIRNFMIPESGGKVEGSDNYGVSFSNFSSGIEPTHNPVSLDISLSTVNNKRIVATNPGYIYHNLGTFPPNGNYFKPQTSIGLRNWTAVAINAYGTIAVALASDGTVWRFVNGNTWAQSNVSGSNSWTCVTMNYTGTVIWIAGNNTHLYRSLDGGQNFVAVPITVTIPSVGNVSSPFNFSNIATDNLGNNTVATVEPSSNSSNLSFIVKNFIGGSVNYNNWSWVWGYTGIYPYNNIVNGNWTGITVSSDATTVYAVNNHPTQGGLYLGLYVWRDDLATFYQTSGSKPYSSISYVRGQNCPASGTVLQEYCDGTTWTQVIADGNCGSYTTVDYNSPNCQVCSTYSASDYGGVSYIDCNGNNQYMNVSPGDFFCALSVNFGPAYQYAVGCDGVPGGGIA